MKQSKPGGKQLSQYENGKAQWRVLNSNPIAINALATATVTSGHGPPASHGNRLRPPRGWWSRESARRPGARAEPRPPLRPPSPLNCLNSDESIAAKSSKLGGEYCSVRSDGVSVFFLDMSRYFKRSPGRHLQAWVI